MTDRIVVGLTGHKRVGKDTAASYFTNFGGFQKYAFADPVREACKAFFGWSFGYMNTNKEGVDPFWGISPRQAMQFIGTEVGRVALSATFPEFKERTGDGIWVRRFEREFFSSQNNFVISDVRFENEMESIRSVTKRSCIIGIKRETDLIDNHASESQIDSLLPSCDFVVENNGSIQDFLIVIEKIHKEILRG